MTYIHRSKSYQPHRCLRVFVNCWEYRVSASAATERKNMYRKQKYFSKEVTSAKTLAQSRQCMGAHQEIKYNNAGLLTSPQLTFYLSSCGRNCSSQRWTSRLIRRHGKFVITKLEDTIPVVLHQYPLVLTQVCQLATHHPRFRRLLHQLCINGGLHIGM
jgi:hypothetical protein